MSVVSQLQQMMLLCVKEMAESSMLSQLLTVRVLLSVSQVIRTTQGGSVVCTLFQKVNFTQRFVIATDCSSKIRRKIKNN